MKNNLPLTIRQSVGELLAASQKEIAMVIQRELEDADRDGDTVGAAILGCFVGELLVLEDGDLEGAAVGTAVSDCFMGEVHCRIHGSRPRRCCSGIHIRLLRGLFGARDGDLEGDTVGAAVLGCFVGEFLGLEDTDYDGDTVGAAVLGCFVGELLADFAEGDYDGDTTTGLAEGEIDGVAFGLAEGEVDEEAVGTVKDLLGLVGGTRDGWFDASRALHVTEQPATVPGTNDPRTPAKQSTEGSTNSFEPQLPRGNDCIHFGVQLTKMCFHFFLYNGNIGCLAIFEI
ncbi:hypothetical protein ACHAWO_001008 [Cyclotella atomus]|jgi:uncharacterized protein YcfJ|uniref:Uncharacterized protein n=1 Tax=Cyclotella atomus TaxID=382360 RepID=A0ABD3QBA6_9STRA